MKFFIDTANLSQIREARDLGILDGVTTNPSLMARENIHGHAAIILTVAHKEFLSLNLSHLKSTGTLIYDVKGILSAYITDSRL